MQSRMYENTLKITLLNPCSFTNSSLFEKCIKTSAEGICLQMLKIEIKPPIIQSQLNQAEHHTSFVFLDYFFYLDVLVSTFPLKIQRIQPF